jgi:hypothetical protein
MAKGLFPHCNFFIIRGESALFVVDLENVDRLQKFPQKSFAPARLFC